ncbi:MAG: glycosyltransferase family 2 protein [Paludibacteraceae bacterium]|nr:glycosyltransferase family 2 protein [Paludibacteraceae bacterium]
MSDNPLFSVLIANYNNGDYLLEAIESVLNQTYVNWEIIIVDDASTDNSGYIYSSLKKDERIHIYSNERNMGCGYTKRRCVELANGELCGFLDADDTILPDAISIMVSAHKNNPSAALVVSRYYLCDEHLNVVSISRKLVLKEGESYLEHRDYQPEVFASFKTCIYNESEGLNKNFPLGVDQDLYFLLEEHGGIIALENITYKCRGHNNSISRIDGGNSAFFWNLIARYHACLRRGLNPRLFPEIDFLDFLKDRYSESNAFEIRKEAADRVRNTRSYKLGNTLLTPMRKLSQFIDNKAITGGGNSLADNLE